jgi:hypothetical protein
MPRAPRHRRARGLARARVAVGGDRGVPRPRPGGRDARARRGAGAGGLDRPCHCLRGGGEPRPGRNHSGDAPGDLARAADVVRGRGPALRRHGPLVRVAAARVRRRAPLPAHGAEPMARGRPGPRGQRRARRLAREHPGPGAAALRRAAGGWTAVSGAQPRPASPLGACLCRGRPPPVRRGAGAGWRRRDRRRRAARRAGHRRQRGGILCVAGRALPPGRLLFLPRLYGGAVGAGRRRVPGPPSRPSVGGVCRRSGPFGGGVAVAAREDDPRGGSAGNDRRHPSSRPSARRLHRRRHRVRGGVSGLLPRHLRYRLAACDLRWASGRTEGLARTRARRPAARPLVRTALARAGVPARDRRSTRGMASPPLAARAAGGGGPRPRPLVADVVGRAMPARAVPGSAGPAARRLCWPSRPSRVADPGPRPLALRSRRPRRRRRRVRRRTPGRSAAAEPGGPPHPPVGGALRRRGCQPLSAVAGRGATG